MQKERSLIMSIYNALYNRVDEKYYDLIVFAEEKAAEKRIKFQPQKIRNRILFYFSQKEKSFEFALFDYFLNSVEFSSKFIEGKKYKYKK